MNPEPQTLPYVDPAALRATARELGYALTSGFEAWRGRIWYVTPAGTTTALCVGADSELQRFFDTHRKWLTRPDGGRKRIARWQAQKLRAARRRRWIPSAHLADAVRAR